MVNMVLLLLKMEVNELIKLLMITANINPFKPVKKYIWCRVVSSQYIARERLFRPGTENETLVGTHGKLYVWSLLYYGYLSIVFVINKNINDMFEKSNW